MIIDFLETHRRKKKILWSNWFLLWIYGNFSISTLCCHHDKSNFCRTETVDESMSNFKRATEYLRQSLLVLKQIYVHE